MGLYPNVLRKPLCPLEVFILDSLFNKKDKAIIKSTSHQVGYLSLMSRGKKLSVGYSQF